jgi:N-acyl-D-aspartate/D-glutamate deacylase
MLDLVIRGAEVIDGSGSPGLITDVGIEGGQITPMTTAPFFAIPI